MGGIRDGWDGGERESDSKTGFTAFNVELNGTFQKTHAFSTRRVRGFIFLGPRS